MHQNNLKTIFHQIQENFKLTPYLKEVCDNISQSEIRYSTIDEILLKYNKNIDVAKADFVHLVFEYIKIALADDILTKEEKYNVSILKRIFKIQPGDFVLHNTGELERILKYQLYFLYKDNVITSDEALYKSDLQELFDLSFDQMNEYSKEEAFISIKKGANPVDLDIFLSHSEYFKIKN